MDAEPKRPWWRRKTWWAVGAVWLAAAYPFGRGPAEYAATRGWVTRAAVDAGYAALDHALPATAGPPVPVSGLAAVPLRPQPPHPVGRHYCRYVGWWRELGYRHEGVFTFYVPIQR